MLQRTPIHHACSLIFVTLLMLAAGSPASRTAYAAPTTVSFSYTGAEQTFVVPPGVTSIDITAVGGTGGGYISPLAGPVSGLPISLPSSVIPGGAGGRVNARLQVQPGQILYIAVGGNGSEGETFNGGGAPGTMCVATLPPFPTMPCYLFLASPLYYGKAGGGASDIRTVSRTQPNSLASRLVVAGGGGGAGGYGAGGAAEQAALPDGQGGKAGTPTGGGAGGAGEPASANYPVAGLPGADGVFGSGGKGADDQLCKPTGGGGGGGYYGGGGGGNNATFVNGSSCSSQTLSGGGGGGSNYVAPSATNIVEELDTTGTPSIIISYILDTDPPSGSLLIANYTGYIGTPQVSLILSASDTGGAGLQSMRFSNDGVNWGGWEPFNTTRLWWTLSDGEGAKTVHAQFRDSANNVSSAASNTVILDTTWPNATVSLNGGAQWTNNPTINVITTCADQHPTNALRLSNRPETALGVLSYSHLEGYVVLKQLSLTDATTGGSTANGPRTVYGQCRDIAVNWSAVRSATIFLDTVAPTGAIAINANAATTTNLNVTLTLAGDDAAPASGLAAMRFSNDGTNWSSWESYAAIKAWTLTTGDGVKTVQVQFRDNAGNLSAITQASITLGTSTPDTTPPSGSISINGGAATTSGASVTLTLAADDPAPGSGVATMRFSNDGVTWSSWEIYATTKAWTLSGGAGSKTVSVQYRDNAGNLSATAQATIAFEPGQLEYYVLLPLIVS